jgi:hypothetical protein
MGVRVYDPTTGRFLQTDPVPGGSANAYEYCGGDPVNAFDLNGQSFWGRAWGFVKNHRTTILTIGSFLPGVGPAFAVAAMVSGGYDAWNDYRHHDYIGAALDVAGVFSGGAGYGYKYAARTAERRAARMLRSKGMRRSAYHKARRALARQARRYHRHKTYSDRFGWGAGAAYEGRYWWNNRHHYF